MYKNLAIILFSILSYNTFAQNFVWTQRFGNLKSDKATSIKADSSGNVYVSGYFSNTVLLGTNNLPLSFTANASSKEAILAKYDSTGQCVWAKSGGQGFDDRVLGMDVAENGDNIAVGTFWQTSSGFNMGSINVTGSPWGGGDQCFIVKHDKNGNPQWGNFVCSNSGDDQGLDVAMDKNGNAYIVGFMTGNILYCGGNTVTATNTNTGFQKHSYWVAKINSAGAFQWARCFGNLPYDTSVFKYIERDIAVCTDDSGGVYITGGFDHTWPFGTGTLTSNGGYDIFVMKYDTAGNFQWAKNGGSKKDDWANGICADNKGFIYVTGEHRDSLLYDTLIVRNYDKRDVFVMKIDAKTGAGIWGKRAGNDLGSERGNDIVADNDCNVWVCGDVRDIAKFGDNITTPPGNSLQSFIAHITPDGKWKWVQTGGGTDSNDRCNAIALGKNKQIYACGFFRSPATFGTTSFSPTGSSDAFITRIVDFDIDQCVSLPTDIELTEITSLHADTMYSCVLLNNNKVSIKIKNNFTIPAYNVKAYIQLNSNSPVMEIVPTAIPAGDSIIYTYNYSPYLYGFGTYNIKLWVRALGDTMPANDTAKYTTTIIPTTVYNQPYAQNFDTSNVLPAYWDINNFDNSNTWSISQCTNIAGQNSNAVKMLSNAGMTNNLDILEMPIVFITNTMLQAGLYFDVAYNDFGQDQLDVFISEDCGVNFVNAGYSKVGNFLNTTTSAGMPYVPFAANQWRREYVDLTSYINKNVIIQFRASKNTSNNIWIDNVNIQENFSAPLNIGNQNNPASFTIYPNPSNGIYNFALKTEKAEKAIVGVYDVKGALVHTYSFNNAVGKNIHNINIQNLPSGMYYAEIIFNGNKQRVKLVKE